MFFVPHLQFNAKSEFIDYAITLSQIHSFSKKTSFIKKEKLSNS